MEAKTTSVFFRAVFTVTDQWQTLPLNKYLFSKTLLGSVPSVANRTKKAQLSGLL